MRLVRTSKHRDSSFYTVAQSVPIVANQMLCNGRELSQRSTFGTRASRDDRGNRGRVMSMMAVLLAASAAWRIAVLWARDCKRRDGRAARHTGKSR
jgi:hypothetical protein